MDNSNSAEQEFWIEFIELYKSKPVLWKYGSEVYKDRKGKKHAYLELVEKLQEVEPSADVDMVKKKINSFRSCYRRKLFNAEEQIKLGLKPDVKWVYFKHFHFLREIKDHLNEGKNRRYSEDSRLAKVEHLEENGDDENQQVEFIPHKRRTSHDYVDTCPSPSPNDSMEEAFDQSNHSNTKNSLKITLNTKENHTFWIEFINIYRSKPELWKTNSEVYKDREGKKYAYLILTEKLREVYPDATADMVRKKINILRTSYRKALNKMKRAIRLGRKPVNNWIYFDHFSFLHESKDPLEEDDNLNAVEEDNEYDTLDNISNGIEQTDNDTIDDDLDGIVGFSPSKNSNKIDHDDDSLPTSPAISLREKMSVPHNQLNHLNNKDDISVKPTTKQKFWIEFIKLYRSKPEIWKRDSEVYKDSRTKRSAYLEMVKKMREIYPNADVGMVKRKINNLHSIYRNVLSRTRRGRRQEKSAYQWIYFNHLSFLNEENDPLDADAGWNDCEVNEYNPVDEMSDNNMQEDLDADENDSVVQFLTTKESAKRQRSPSPNHNERAHNETTDSSLKKFKHYNDEADILGISWAYQYRSLSETQKIFAKKAIDDILFEARLETLHRNSVKINERGCDRCKHT